MAPFLVEQTSESFSNYSASNSISKIPISCTDPSGSFHMLKPGIPWSHFTNAASMSLAVAASSSFAIEADPEDISSVQFRVPKKSAGTSHDRIAFYISGSGEIGVGTKDPETSFDIRDVKQDVDPKLAKLHKEKLLLLDRTDEAADVKAQKLKTARTIGGVSFDGSANINLPGVNTKGSQDTTGQSGTALLLTNARFFRTNLGSTTKVAFNGGADITPGVQGTLPVSNGGTGMSSVADKSVIISQDSGTDTLSGVQMDGSGELLIGGASGPAVSTLTAGTNVTITNANGAITIASADTQLSIEQVQDIVGGMFSSNTETNITATYQDADGTIDLVSSIAHHKGSTTNYPFFGTDFFAFSTAAKTQLYLVPNIFVAPTAVIANGAGPFMCNKTLPLGLVPNGVTVYGNSNKDTYKVYLSFIPDNSDYSGIKTKYTQIDSAGDNGTAVNTAVSGAAIESALKTLKIDWDSRLHAVSIVVTTAGANTIYGGTITMK